MNIFQNLIYLAKLSKWIKQHKLPEEFLKYLDKIKYPTRYDLYKYIIIKERLAEQKIYYLEFGVYKGDSLRWWSNNLQNPKSQLYGFDTFIGIPEDYRNLKKGHFSTEGKLPEITDGRINYEVGLFSETLIPFLTKINLNNRTIVHLDADLYSSTLYVLTTLIPKLPKRSIIIFDEFSGSFAEHEFRAFLDFVTTFKISYQILGAVRNFMHVAVILEKK